MHDKAAYKTLTKLQHIDLEEVTENNPATVQLYFVSYHIFIVFLSFVIHGPPRPQCRIKRGFGPNYFSFMGKFMKNQEKCQKQTPLDGFEPPFHKSWIRPWTRGKEGNLAEICAVPTEQWKYPRYHQALRL